MRVERLELRIQVLSLTKLEILLHYSIRVLEVVETSAGISVLVSKCDLDRVSRLQHVLLNLHTLSIEHARWVERRIIEHDTFHCLTVEVDKKIFLLRWLLQNLERYAHAALIRVAYHVRILSYLCEAQGLGRSARLKRSCFAFQLPP